MPIKEIVFVDAAKKAAIGEVLSKAQEFNRAVRAHDFSYGYSEDPNVYQNGYESLQRIRRLATGLPSNYVREVYNSRVDELFAEEHRSMFYWPQ